MQRLFPPPAAPGDVRSASALTASGGGGDGPDAFYAQRKVSVMVVFVCLLICVCV